MSPNYSEYLNAVSRLEEAIAQPKNEFIRDSVIQRFEFCVELAWKSAKKSMGTQTSSPKDVIREMAQSSYIENVELWLRAIDMQNLSSQTYKEELAEQVYGFVCSFFPEFKGLAERLVQK